VRTHPLRQCQAREFKAPSAELDGSQSNSPRSCKSARPTWDRESGPLLKDTKRLPRGLRPPSNAEGSSLRVFTESADRKGFDAGFATLEFTRRHRTRGHEFELLSDCRPHRWPGCREASRPATEGQNPHRPSSWLPRQLSTACCLRLATAAPGAKQNRPLAHSGR